MKQLFALSFFLFLNLSFGQSSIAAALDSYNEHNIPYITIENLKEQFESAILIDARQKKEYEVSHLKNAVRLDSDNMDTDKIKNTLKSESDLIIVYCSIGVRSEDLANQLKQMGYSNVFNLYGGIFEWVNLGNEVFDSNGNSTNEVHTYSKSWSKYLKRGTKIYE